MQDGVLAASPPIRLVAFLEGWWVFTVCVEEYDQVWSRPGIAYPFLEIRFRALLFLSGDVVVLGTVGKTTWRVGYAVTQEYTEVICVHAQTRLWLS